MSSTTPDISAIKARLRSTWMAGDFGQIAKFTVKGAEQFVSHLAITKGMNFLDVACGTGNVAIAAARLGARVTGLDIAANLLEQANARAASEDLTIQFDEGDAEQLPYANGSFDVVSTMFGAMFAPRPEKVAAELVRVCRPGGRIAMANWTPQGFVGQMFRLVSKHAPPPPGIVPPVLWGDEKKVQERLSNGISDLKFERRPIMFEFPFAVPEVVEFFRLYFGPMQRAFEALDGEKQNNLRADLEELYRQKNRATDQTTSVQSEYLEVIALRA